MAVDREFTYTGSAGPGPGGQNAEEWTDGRAEGTLWTTVQRFSLLFIKTIKQRECLTFRFTRKSKYRFLLSKTRFLNTAPDPINSEMEHKLRLTTHQQRTGVRMTWVLTNSLKWTCADSQRFIYLAKSFLMQTETIPIAKQLSESLVAELYAFHPRASREGMFEETSHTDQAAFPQCLQHTFIFAWMIFSILFQGSLGGNTRCLLSLTWKRVDEHRARLND